MPSQVTEGRTEQTADKVLRLLVLLSEAKTPQSARQLASGLGCPISSVYRYLSVLRDWDLIQDDLLGEGFTIGPRALALSGAFYDQFQLASLSLGVMGRLMLQTGETVLLLIPAAGQVVCVESVESHRPLRYSFQRGVVISSPLRGASAQAMLPYYSEGFIRQALAQEPDLSAAALLKKREDIRIQGYAISEGEVDEGVVAVASAILGPAERLLGSVSIVAPALRVDGAKRREYAGLICAAAQEISALVKEGRSLT